MQHHPDRRVRTTALAVLVERDGVATHAVALTEALGGTDREVARWALQTLASREHDGDDVAETLALILETRARRLPPEISASIADLLLQREGAARHAASALSILCRSPRPALARIARRLAAGLRARAEDLEVQRALRRWRRSPARWLSLLPAAWTGGRRG
jgi:hypothetical protein